MLILLLSVLYACKSNTDKPETKETQTTNTTNTTNTTKESTSAKETTANDVKLNSEEMKKLNIFFSNFSEVNLKPFTEGKIADDDLINFGVLHLYKNNLGMFEKVDAGNFKIKEDKVSASVQKYFSKNIGSHKSTSEFKYKNGFYFIEIADGEAYTFSQVESLTDIGNDRYVAYVNVYTAGSGWTGDAHGSMKEWKSNGEEEVPVLTEKYKATFEKKNSGNVLVEYGKR